MNKLYHLIGQRPKILIGSVQLIRKEGLIPVSYTHLLDPVGLKDEYCPSYFHEMRNLTLVNRAYCIRNPKHYKGFGPDCWGLTASYSVDGYAAHSPNEQEDKGHLRQQCSAKELSRTNDNRSPIV